MSPVKNNSNSKFNSNKPLFLAVVSFCVLLALGYIGIKKPQLVGQVQTATMLFSFSNGKQQTFSGPVMDKMTVLEAVLASVQGDDLKVVYYTDDKNNVILSAINNDLNIKDHQWSFYLNRVLIKTEDINKIYVRVGDLIEAKYQ